MKHSKTNVKNGSRAARFMGIPVDEWGKNRALSGLTRCGAQSPDSARRDLSH
jgi:hypothetical protein